jgi:hypothetical protein
MTRVYDHESDRAFVAPYDQAQDTGDLESCVLDLYRLLPVRAVELVVAAVLDVEEEA